MNERQENLQDYLQKLQNEISDQLREPDPLETVYAYPEPTFTKIATELLQAHDLTGDVTLVQFQSRYGKSLVKVDGYFLDEDNTRLDVFVTEYNPAPLVQTIGTPQIKKLLMQCLHFLEGCAYGGLEKKIPDIANARELADVIHDNYTSFEQLRIFVLTNELTSGRKNTYNPLYFDNRLTNIEIVDLLRLSRMDKEGDIAEAVNVDFTELHGSPLPFISVADESYGYQCLLTSIPGRTLESLYARYDARLLEANVRSFLGATGKINKGIQKTLDTEPERFLAYNNGLVILADTFTTENMNNGMPGICSLNNFQIVNGGQTTASLFFAARRDRDIDLDHVLISAKIIIPGTIQDSERQNLVSNISKYANSQNKVQVSDLSANNRFHIDLEKVSKTVYSPDGKTLWFYERATGSYRTMMALRQGTAQAKRLKATIPPSHKLPKAQVAKYINTWHELPHIVSLGAQKNFVEFMNRLASQEKESGYKEPTADYWKKIVALAILYKRLFAECKKTFKAFQGNITTYTISTFAHEYGEKVNLLTIWNQQGLSDVLLGSLMQRATEVERALYNSANGRMLSEWAKKEGCWKER